MAQVLDPAKLAIRSAVTEEAPPASKKPSEKAQAAFGKAVQDYKDKMATLPGLSASPAAGSSSPAYGVSPLSPDSPGWSAGSPGWADGQPGIQSAVWLGGGFPQVQDKGSPLVQEAAFFGWDPPKKPGSQYASLSGDLERLGEKGARDHIKDLRNKGLTPEADRELLASTIAAKDSAGRTAALKEFGTQYANINIGAYTGTRRQAHHTGPAPRHWLYTCSEPGHDA